MILFLFCWFVSGIFGTVMVTWSNSHEINSNSISDPNNIESRTITVGYIILGMVLGPIILILGLFLVLSILDFMKYVDKFLSAPIFIWPQKDKEKN